MSKCPYCGKRVYFAERQVCEGKEFHGACVLKYMKDKKEQKRDWLPPSTKQNLEKVTSNPAYQQQSSDDSNNEASSSSNEGHVPNGFLIFGPPGVGKGTQCELIAKESNIVHISTGDMLRAAANSGSVLGLQIKNILKEGGLVNDDLMIKIVKDRLNQSDVKNQGFLLDGFPRTGKQAQALKNSGVNVKALFLLEADDQTVIERITGRRTDPQTGKIYHLVHNPPPPEIESRLVQRNDDTEKVVRHRLEEYRGHLLEVEDHFSDVIVKIDGSGDPDAVFQQTRPHLVLLRMYR